MTISERCRREDSRNCRTARFEADSGSSSRILPMYRISRHTPSGELIEVRVSCVTILVTASLSFFLISYSRLRAWYWTMSELDCTASCTSLVHRRTTSGPTRIRWVPDTRAADATRVFLSTMACLMYRSMAPSIWPSMMRARTRMALARYRSSFEFMSLVRLEVTMITSSGLHVSATSLMKRYIIRRRYGSGLWKSLVTPKNTSVTSLEESDSPWVTMCRSLVINVAHSRGLFVTTSWSEKHRHSWRTVAFSKSAKGDGSSSSSSLNLSFRPWISLIMDDTVNSLCSAALAGADILEVHLEAES
mmetsp:Transcript_56919/g.128973  ORF Transcript_56919/g.128973 Transcript_56919/m.128973 type:complete len:304 (+) Transcript_56919:1139-2050(+)